MDSRGPDIHPSTATDVLHGTSDEKSLERDEKAYYTKGDIETTSPPPYEASETVLHSEREIATHVISVDDDPSLNPWTFRAFFLGLGLSAFGGSLGTFVSLVAFLLFIMQNS